MTALRGSTMLLGALAGTRRLFLYGMSMGRRPCLWQAGLSFRPMWSASSPTAGTSPAAIIKKVLREQHCPIFPVYYLTRLGGMLFGGFDLEAASAVDALAHCKTPVLLIHGGALPSKEHHGAGTDSAIRIDRKAYLDTLNVFIKSSLE